MIKQGIDHQHELTFINPESHMNRWRPTHRFVFGLGAYGWTKVCVYADHLDSAFDEAIDWMVEHTPGLIRDDEVNEIYREAYDKAIAAGLGDEDANGRAWEEAEVDTISGGNCGNHVHCGDFHLIAEDPDRETMLSLLGRPRWGR